MLLFYEAQPDAIPIRHETEPEIKNHQHHAPIDPLSRFGSHAFLRFTSIDSESTTFANNAYSSRTCVDELSVLHSSSWTYCGPLLTAQSDKLPSSFHQWAAFTLNQPPILVERLLPLLSFLQDMLFAAGAKHYWMTIRATKPTHDYDLPRWHVDENFFSADPNVDGLGFGSLDGSQCWKLATTLLGPSTLFLTKNSFALNTLRQTRARERARIGDHVCTSIRCLGCATYAETVRHDLAQCLHQESIESSAYGEVAFFRTGDRVGAVHSEPKCDTDRIFVNIIPGTDEDLKALTTRFGISYPRAWCIGNPIGFILSDEKEALTASPSLAK